MISQHLQATIPSVSFANAELQEFIDNRADAREVRKAVFCETGLSKISGYKQKPGLDVFLL